MRRANNLTTFMCRVSWNLVVLNLLETSGPVQACNGIALPLPTPLTRAHDIPPHHFPRPYSLTNQPPDTDRTVKQQICVHTHCCALSTGEDQKTLWSFCQHNSNSTSNMASNTTVFTVFTATKISNRTTSALQAVAHQHTSHSTTH